MRFDKFIEFISVSSPYNKETGNHDEVESVIGSRWADITDASRKAMQLMYGEIRQGALVMRVGDPFNLPADFIRYNGKYYRIDAMRLPSRRQSFLVTEVVGRVSPTTGA